LIPQNVEELGVEREPGVYLFADLESANDWNNSSSEMRSVLGEDGKNDIWKVTIPSTFKLYPDEASDMQEDDSWYTDKPIPASWLSLIKAG